jgi:hypothetical protein
VVAPPACASVAAAFWVVSALLLSPAYVLPRPPHLPSTKTKEKIAATTMPNLALYTLQYPERIEALVLY